MVLLVYFLDLFRCILDFPTLCWLYSFLDLGKKDSNGFVYVTGRIKEIYVSSAGKNIAPLVIEETMKSIQIKEW